MKYIIKRTSEKPIGLEGLIPEEIHEIVRFMKEYYDIHPGRWFYKNFTNIKLVERTGNPYYEGVAKEAKKVHLYEVNTLEEMNALVKKVGPVIIFPPECAEGYHVLEIYDDYRE